MKELVISKVEGGYVCRVVDKDPEVSKIFVETTLAAVVKAVKAYFEGE